MGTSEDGPLSLGRKQTLDDIDWPLQEATRGMGGALGPGWREEGGKAVANRVVGCTSVQPLPQASDFNLLEPLLRISSRQMGHNNSHFTDALEGSNALPGDVPSTQCRA